MIFEGVLKCDGAAHPKGDRIFYSRAARVVAVRQHIEP